GSLAPWLGSRLSSYEPGGSFCPPGQGCFSPLRRPVSLHDSAQPENILAQPVALAEGMAVVFQAKLRLPKGKLGRHLVQAAHPPVAPPAPAQQRAELHLHPLQRRDDL